MTLTDYQAKQLEKVVVLKEKPFETDHFLYFRTVYIDKLGRHEHLVTYDKTEPRLINRYRCTCTWCSSYGMDKNGNLTKWCIFTKAVAIWMVSNNLIDKFLLQLLEAN